MGLKRVYGTVLGASLFILTGCGMSTPVAKSPTPHTQKSSSPSKKKTTTPNLAAIFGQDTPVSPGTLPNLASPNETVALTVIPLHATYGTSAPGRITIPSQVTMPGASTSPRWVAYALHTYLSHPIYVIGLTGMHTHHPLVGADGSWNLDLTKGSLQVTVSDTPACYGCAVDGSAALFKSAQQASASYGGPYTGPMLSSLGHYVSFDYLSHHLVVYGYHMAHGLEDWTFVDVNMSGINRPGGLFFSGSVIGPPSDAKLANTILADVYQQLSGKAKGY